MAHRGRSYAADIPVGVQFSFVGKESTWFVSFGLIVRKIGVLSHTRGVGHGQSDGKVMTFFRQTAISPPFGASLV
jgi:hypothetical protein